MGWAEAVSSCYDSAQAWLSANAQAPPPEREAEYVALTSQTHALGLRYARSKEHPCQALASLFHTWQARGQNPLEACLKLLSQPTASPV